MSKKNPPLYQIMADSAETEGFEPSIPFRGIHTFQACSFNHSDKSPVFYKSVLTPFRGSTLSPDMGRDSFNHSDGHLYSLRAAKIGILVVSNAIY